MPYVMHIEVIADFPIIHVLRIIQLDPMASR